MKKTFLGLTLMLSSFVALSATSTTSTTTKPTQNKNAERGQIGSTFSAPVMYQNHLYFLATTGVLYQSNPDLTSVNQLYIGKKQTVSGLSLVGSTLYWGEGLHDDKKSTLHSFDLNTKKMLKEVEVDGHIEREIFAHAGTLYIGTGFGGVSAFKESNLEKLWQTKDVEGKAIHADGNILLVEDKICTTSIYEYKGIICLDPKTGKLLSHIDLLKNPKSEIVASNSLIIGFATEANLSENKWTVPSDFYVYDVKANKMQVLKELRGFNFFAPLISSDFAFVTLSTGDFITISLKNGAIGFMGEFAEPFINNTFMMKNSYCSIGVMGKILCYSKTKGSTYALSEDKRFLETPIGKIATVGGKIYAPSRIGYFIVE